MADVALDYTFYGTVAEGDTYFANRLHSTMWTGSNKAKALYEATRIIDALAYKGDKHTVYTLLSAYTYPDAPTAQQIRTANAAQALEFPRDEDLVIPQDIRTACYEIAYALLDGKNPDLDLEALAIRHQQYGSVSTTYNRDQVPLEHVENGVPSATAWRMLRPFLRTSSEFDVSRVS